MIRRHPRSTLFLSTTLFRSLVGEADEPGVAVVLRRPGLAGGELVRELGLDRGARADDGREDRLRLVGHVLREDGSEEHTSELQSRQYLVCRLLLEKKNNTTE